MLPPPRALSASRSHRTRSGRHQAACGRPAVFSGKPEPRPPDAVRRTVDQKFAVTDNIIHGRPILMTQVRWCLIVRCSDHASHIGCIRGIVQTPARDTGQIYRTIRGQEAKRTLKREVEPGAGIEPATSSLQNGSWGLFRTIQDTAITKTKSA
jgi:hypothetical protein